MRANYYKSPASLLRLWDIVEDTIITTEEPPVPLGPQTKETCLFLRADVNDWSPLELTNGRSVHFYTVTTLYTEERDFEKRNGLAPLMRRLGEHGYLNIVGVQRPNVAIKLK